MLLQVVQSTRPIEVAFDGVAHGRRRSFNHVPDRCVFALDTVNDAGIANRSGIVRLAAASRVEGRAIQSDG